MLKPNSLFVAILILFVGVAGFGFSGGACNSDKPMDQAQFEKNTRVAVNIGAASARDVQAEVNSLCRAELIKPESCGKAQPHIDRVVQIADKIDNFLDIHPKITPDNRDELLELADDVIKELDALQADGVIEFKDPDKRRNFLLTLALGRSGIRVARVAIAEMPTESKSPSPKSEASPSQ